MLFRSFLLDTNQDYSLDVLCSCPTYDRDCYSNFLCFYLAKIRTAIQISSISSCHKSGLLVRYHLALPSVRARLLYRYSPFLLGKNQDCYSDILCFYLTQIKTIVQISSIPTRPKTKIAIPISSVSSWQKSGLLFKYPLSSRNPILRLTSYGAVHLTIPQSPSS